jgi:hypothetical protein
MELIEIIVVASAAMVLFATLRAVGTAVEVRGAARRRVPVHDGSAGRDALKAAHQIIEDHLTELNNMTPEALDRYIGKIGDDR